MVLEVMGRHSGWIATHAGIAGGADAILVPERPFEVEQVAEHLRKRHARGPNFSIVVVAEGATPHKGTLHVHSDAATDAFGHARLGGIGVALERELERITGYESRVTILGHIQRGGSPVAYDRVLATRFGVAAMDAALGGRFGTMVGLQGTAIVETPLLDALREPKLLDPALYATAELFFG
jgi:6-phosphofructokinase 1